MQAKELFTNSKKSVWFWTTVFHVSVAWVTFYVIAITFTTIMNMVNGVTTDLTNYEVARYTAILGTIMLVGSLLMIGSNEYRSGNAQNSAEENERNY